MLKNTRNQYGSVSKIFHWGIFILVSLMLLCGFFMEDFPKFIQPMTYMLHKSTGILIFGLIILRLLWRCINITPTLSTIPTWEKIAARVTHALLYVLLLAMPISGWIMSTAAGKIPAFYGLINIPFPGIEPNEVLAKNAANAHEVLAFLLLFLIGLHIMAALKHHFWNKDDVLKRMTS